MLRCLLFVCAALLTSTTSAQTAAPAPPTEREYLSVRGAVVSTQPESFRLDYGKGIIVVMVPDWSWLRGGRKLIDDHRVTVYGRVEESGKGERRIMATGVYDEDLGTYYDVVAQDAADRPGLQTMTQPLAAGQIEVAGRVASVAGRELVLRSGTRIDTRNLHYDPLDDKGYPQIGPGDMIKASGYLAKDILQGTEVVAAWIIELYPREAP
jgi:hypothetical protein